MKVKAHTKEDKLKKVQKISELYSTDNYSIDECCKTQSITKTTFYDWINDDAELDEIYRTSIIEARNNYTSELKKRALRAFEKKLEERVEENIEYYFNLEEVETLVNGQIIKEKVSVPKGLTKKTKKVMPSDTIIIFALTNMFPDEFKNKHSVEVDEITNLSNDAINHKIKELEQKISDEQKSIKK